MDNRRYGLRRFTTAAIPAVLRLSATTAAFAAERAFQDIAASAAVLNAFSSPLLWSQKHASHDEYYLGLCNVLLAIMTFVVQRLSNHGAASFRSMASSKSASKTVMWTRLSVSFRESL